MTTKHIELTIIKLCLLGLLSGCASTPDTRIDQQNDAGLRDNSLDVLFAMEFPVESAADAVTRAAQAHQDGEIDKALFFYVRALQFRPENVDVLARIGEIQMQRKNYVVANRAFLLARSYDPTHARSLEGLGLVYMASDMHELAVKEFKSAISYDNQLWRAHNAIGVYEDKVGNFETAQRHYDAALSINPDGAQILNNRGYSKFLAGDSHGAALDFYEAAENLNFPPAWANLGKLYAEQRWYDSAIKTYKQVMSEAHALNNTGRAAFENGDFKQARLYLTEAIRLSPTYFPAAEENLSLLDHAQ